MFLIVNLGLKSIRVIVFDTEGNQVYSSTRPVHSTLLGYQVEQDPHEWLRLLDELMTELKDTTNLASSIRFITSTTSSSCILGVDANGDPITKVLMVSDKRAVAQAKFINTHPAFQRLSATTSVNCNASFVVPKSMWFKENMPEIFEKVRFWLGAGEFLNYYFTKEFFTDELNASKAFYADGSYPGALFASLDLNIESMPPVRPIGSTVTIDHKVLVKHSLNVGCKYVLTTYDAICAVIGSSTDESGNACDVSGTVTSVRILSEHPVRGTSPILLNQRVDIFDRYIVGSSNNLGGGIIEWFKQAFFDPTDSNVYFKMENYAQSSRVGANGLIFLPYLLGERSPFSAPDAKGTFFGIGRNTSIVEFTRAVFESAGYVTKGMIELIMTSDTNVSSLTVSGGMSRFDTINQIKADVANVPVYVVENFESTSIGALIILCVSQKIIPTMNDAMKQYVRIRKIIKPSARNHALYQDYFGLFKTINSSMLQYYSFHGALGEKYHDHKNEVVRNL